VRAVNARTPQSTSEEIARIRYYPALMIVNKDRIADDGLPSTGHCQEPRLSPGVRR
jgi:hypothetical protein